MMMPPPHPCPDFEDVKGGGRKKKKNELFGREFGRLDDWTRRAFVGEGALKTLASRIYVVGVE